MPFIRIRLVEGSYKLEKPEAVLCVVMTCMIPCRQWEAAEKESVA